MSEKTAPRSYGGLLFPLVLIALGLAFLLANLGYIPTISVRTLFRLWPLVLILIGIDIVLGRRQPALALGLQVGAIALGVAIVAAQPAGLFVTPGPTTTDETIARDGSTSIALSLEGGAGQYTISGGSTALADVRSDGVAVRVRTTRSDGRATVRVDDPADDPFPFHGGPRNVVVRLANDIPSSVVLDGGAGEFILDLRELMLTEATIETGASSVEITLPAKPQGDVRIRVEAGAASIAIHVPGTVEARVSTSGGAISFSSLDQRLPVVSGSAQTSGYGNATGRVTVTVEAGASSIVIN